MPVGIRSVRSVLLLVALSALGLAIGLAVRSPVGDEDSPRIQAERASDGAPVGEVLADDIVGNAASPVAWEGMERVTIASAYIPLARARSVEDLLPFTDGAAIVTVHGVAEQFRLYGEERRAATAEDVEEFAAAGKTIQEGQLIGPEGFLMTRLNATVRWLDGTREEAQLVVSGGIVDGKVHELEGLPLPGPGPTYFFFLRRAPEGLVPEAIQFVLEGDKLQPLTFPASGLSKALAGRTPDEIREEVLDAYRNSPPKRREAPRVSE